MILMINHDDDDGDGDDLVGDDEVDLDSDRSYGQADKRPHNPAPVLLHHP